MTIIRDDILVLMTQDHADRYRRLLSMLTQSGRRLMEIKAKLRRAVRK